MIKLQLKDSAVHCGGREKNYIYFMLEYIKGRRDLYYLWPLQILM